MKLAVEALALHRRLHNANRHSGPGSDLARAPLAGTGAVFVFSLRSAA